MECGLRTDADSLLYDWSKTMVKALVFDLDGTIVSPGTGTYSPAIADAFHKLREKGILLIAATGRSPYELQTTKMIDGLCFDAIVSLNGQYCYTETEDLFINPFTTELAEQLLRQIEHAGYPCAVIQRKDTYINYATPFVEKAQSDINMPVPLLRELSHFFGEEILMLTVFVPNQEETAFIQMLPSVTATRWHPYAVDLVPSGSGKCCGVEFVLRHFGISWSEVFAFGDGDNDCEMLRCAGRGFAMGNADRRLLNGEFEITDDVEKDGVLNTLRKYGIL